MPKAARVTGLYQVYRVQKVLPLTRSVSMTLSLSLPEFETSSSDPTSTTSTSDLSESSFSSDISPCSTDNTLSMITTPWTTESWSVGSIPGTYSETFTMANISSLTIDPATTVSTGADRPQLYSPSLNTLLEISEPNTCCSVNLKCPSKTAVSKRNTSESTFESWTVESFTSFVHYSDSNIIKVKYPWSPCSYLSGTDIYPDSMDTSSRISLVSLKTLDSMDMITSAPKVMSS
ncbi:jg23051 [Pararge aegeria aegeria]|uniref:Jg23051 protein n=1 Tax=Pararge aegeria aegeria TaxID=348720 RepID=A0A8S4S0C0_9NEOP|nr:jg23051 [Pararge aegeria aegeria]